MENAQVVLLKGEEQPMSEGRRIPRLSLSDRFRSLNLTSPIVLPCPPFTEI